MFFHAIPRLSSCVPLQNRIKTIKYQMLNLIIKYQKIKTKQNNNLMAIQQSKEKQLYGNAVPIYSRVTAFNTEVFQEFFLDLRCENYKLNITYADSRLMWSYFRCLVPRQTESMCLPIVVPLESNQSCQKRQ